MIGHQAVGVKNPVKAFSDPVQGTQERDSLIVCAAEKDIIPLVTASGHMVQRSG